MPPVTFYFDVGSPYACLAAERMERVLARRRGGVAARPARGAVQAHRAQLVGARRSRRRQSGMAEVEARARVTACRRCAGPTRGRGITCSRCAR